MTTDVRLFDSITDAGPDAAGTVAVSGSHGGLFAAAVASLSGLRAVILNDAGRGMNEAGIAGVRALADVGMAACTVDCMSAEIGSARDAATHGVISFVNAIAAGLGIASGMTAGNALDLLAAAPQPDRLMAKVPETRQDRTLGGQEVLCVDSASLITPQDAGRIIITGSHGGLIGGDPARACKADARYVAFSDAGRGKNDVGIGRLSALDARKIAAATLDCMSCEIGNAASMLESGVISAVNQTATHCGIRPGMRHKDALQALMRSDRGQPHLHQ